MAIAQTPSPLANIQSAKTYNAVWFKQTGFTSEQAISAAIAQAASDYPTGGAVVYVPLILFPYTIGLVTQNPLVALALESSVLAGYGAPEGVVPGAVGFLYQQLDGISGLVLWNKISGTGTTGWSIVGNVAPVTAITNRFIDWTAVWAGINNGDLATTGGVIVGLSRTHQTAGTPTMMQTTAGGTSPVLNVTADGRRGAAWFNGVGTNVCMIFRPTTFGASEILALPFIGPTFPTSTGALGTTFEAPQFNFSTSISAWVRKVAGGDSSSCRMCVGFGNNTTANPSKTMPRVGLLGDGAGGYKYGSVNCPDAQAGGNNADNDIDANAVQPADQVAPGTNWWHMRIKLIPATPTSGAKIACYHNFNLVATFTTQTNFPRGHQGTSDSYGRIEAGVYNFSGDTAGLHVPELIVSELRFIMEDDLTV